MECTSSVAQSYGLSLTHVKVTTDPAEMRRHTVNFYTDLFRADACDVAGASVGASLSEFTEL